MTKGSTGNKKRMTRKYGKNKALISDCLKLPNLEEAKKSLEHAALAELFELMRMRSLRRLKRKLLEPWQALL